MSLPIKTMTQQKYIRDYSVMWFSTYSEETNSFTFCRYSSNSLGTDGKFREPIQTPSISSQSPWLCLCSCKEAVTKTSSCLLTHGRLGTISTLYVQAHLATCSVCTWKVGQLEGGPGQTQTRIMLPELLPKPSNRNMEGAGVNLIHFDTVCTGFCICLCLHLNKKRVPCKC